MIGLIAGVSSYHNPQDASVSCENKEKCVSTCWRTCYQCDTSKVDMSVESLPVVCISKNESTICTSYGGIMKNAYLVGVVISIIGGVVMITSFCMASITSLYHMRLVKSKQSNYIFKSGIIVLIRFY